MSTPMTVPNQFRVGFCETACEEHRRLHAVAVTAIQQGLEPFLRSQHPVAIYGEVELFGGLEAATYSVSRAGMSSGLIHQRRLCLDKTIDPESESVRCDQALDLHQQFLPAQVTLEVDQATRKKERILKNAPDNSQMVGVSHIHFEDRLGRSSFNAGRVAFCTVHKRAQVCYRFTCLHVYLARMLAFMSDNA